MELKKYLERTTQAAFADEVHVSQGMVGHWVTGRKRITAEKAVAIENATNGEVTRYELRPDIFGEPPQEAA